MTTRNLRSLITLLLLSTLVCCGFYRTRARPTDAEEIRAGEEQAITKPAKAHLKDGSVVLFHEGFRLKGANIVGAGEKYDFARTGRELVGSIPLEDVGALEYYDRELRTIPTLAGTSGAVLVGVPVAVFLFKTIFGSCPTVYTCDGNARFLEAELFSHSITRTFESGDLDLLNGGGEQDDRLFLEVANEALETHYINRIGLLSVNHPPGYRALPSQDGKVVLFGRETELLEAASRDGRDVAGLIASRDGEWYRSDPDAAVEMTRGSAEDWVDISVRVPPGAREMVLAVRARNTLLATVLLYDVMLRSQGVRAIEWMGSEGSSLLYAWRLHRWFESNFSLRVGVWDGGRFRERGDFMVTGPIAWHEEAMRIPLPEGETCRIRLASLPDNWMLDWVGVSFDPQPPCEIRAVRASALEDAEGNNREESLGLVEKDDDRYLITSPGERYTVIFDGVPVPPGMEQTRLIRSGGFYVEWLRGEWLAQPPGGRSETGFSMDDRTIARTARLWLEKREALEKAFFETTIPLAGGSRP